MRAAYRLLSALGTAKAAARGPEALAKRQVRRAAHRRLARILRKVLDS